jgi:hypothetical protein
LNRDEAEKAQEHIESFFGRVINLGGLMRAVTDGGLPAVLEFRGTGKRVLLDLTVDPVQVTTGGPGIEASVAMAASTEDLHETLLGRLPLMRGINERRLLVKGGMNKLVAFFPVFGLVPVLYADHLLSVNGKPDRKRPGWFRRGLAGFFGFFFGLFAWLGGKIMKGFRPRELIDALAAMSRGAGRFLPRIGKKEPPEKMEKPDNPLDEPAASWARRAWLRLVSGTLFVAGWKLSLFKYKFGIPVDLFRVMESLSKSMARPVGGGGRDS